MKIDYISDTHFDTHLGHGDLLGERFTKRFSTVFETKQSDTLIIAGDIGENNSQNIEALRLLRDFIGYKNIVMVLGNHDWFLTDRMAWENYDGLSINRVNEFKDMVAAEEGIYLLDGDIVEIDGIKIGGTMGWYDASYVFHNLNFNKTKDRDYIQRLWGEFYPDGDLIYGCCDTYDEFCKFELAKIERIHKDCDLMVTHINPSIKTEHTAKEFQKIDTTAFFTFDGTQYLMNTTATHWIFGHSHDQKEFERHRVKCVSNPFGYPGEWNKDFKVRTIDV
jgi:predicted phosphodiesterase